MQRSEDTRITRENCVKTEEETTSDYKQWLHAMKLVARLPGGIPPEFRRKLWLSLADKYLKSKNVSWAKEEEKCFCEKWREDDEELGIQIVKDLHRTGSTLCTGPTGDLNQAKLKRILLGYARYNPEVGYCQGFNMLGALILQVMDKNESESIKVMIYLVEGILPPGYFCGSMGGLQADMAVFRELMLTKLPRLAKHLQKLQGPIENAYEPPLTNVFTMQWFLTMFCTCLPMSCVLRVWDLVLIEGSDVLLRTALALWSLLEERALSARSADDFYCKMGSFSSELLNGHLIDSNGLIEKIVELGPIADMQKLRDKHLYSIAPIERKQGLQIYFDDDEPDIDEDSRLAVATVWGLPWGRRGSQGQPNNNIAKPTIENKDRIALDISLLKKQYDRLRERQKQAQIILTTACTTASRHSATTASLPVNQLLSGRPAIVTNKGRRSGPPSGAIPPARKPSLPAVLHDKSLEKQLRRGETLSWQDTKEIESRRNSLSWKEIKAERAAISTSGSIDRLKSQKIRSGRFGKSDSSSYSEESDENEIAVDEAASCSDTSQCDDDLQHTANDKKQEPHNATNRKSSSKTPRKSKKATLNQRNHSVEKKDFGKRTRPKSWAPSNTEIPFTLMTADSPTHSAEENLDLEVFKTTEESILQEENHALTESQTNIDKIENLKWQNENLSPISGQLAISIVKANISTKEDIPFFGTTVSALGGSNKKDDNITTFDISSEGVTNEYFERVNSTERPTKLDLLYSLNEDENVQEIKIDGEDMVTSNEGTRLYASDNSLNKSSNIRCMDLLVDYSEKSSTAFIEEAKTEISTTFQAVDALTGKSLKNDYNDFKNENFAKRPKTSAEKRRDPRRLTLTRSSTMDIEQRYEALEKRFSMEVYSNYTGFSAETEFNFDSNKTSHQNSIINFKNTKNISSDPVNHVTINKVLSREKLFSLDKKIPSTVDLEQRFENLQKQIIKDRNKMFKSPTDSENSEVPILNTSSGKDIESSQKAKNTKELKKHNNQDDNGKTEEGQVLNKYSYTEEDAASSNEPNAINRHSNDKVIQRNVIHDSESRISEIKPTVQTKKEPPDENKNENALRKNTDSKIEINTGKTVKDLKELEIDAGKTFEKRIVADHDSTKIRPNRTSPLSTEQLEKRVCALEDQINPVKWEASESVRSNLEIKQVTPDENKNEKAFRKNTDSEIEINTGKNVKHLEEVAEHAGKTFEETIVGDHDSTNIKADRCSPLSTEQLEKRVCALEEQINSSKCESSESVRSIIGTKKEHADANGNENTLRKNTESKIEINTDKNVKDLEQLEKDAGKIIDETVLKSNDSNKIRSNRTSSSTKQIEKQDDQINSEKCESLRSTQYEKRKESEENQENERLRETESNNDQKNTDISTNNESLEPTRSLKKFDIVSDKNTHRRLSEPPSTEDLERRYEVLKRRMSSRNFETKTLHKEKLTVEPQQVNKISPSNTSTNSPTKRSPPSIENLEERFEKLQNKRELNSATIRQSPPSAENLEERFEKLRNINDAARATTKQYSTSKNKAQLDIKKLGNKAAEMMPSTQPENSASNANITEKKLVKNDELNLSDNKVRKFNPPTDEMLPEEHVQGTQGPVNNIAKNSNKIKMKLIEELQARIKEHSTDTNIESTVEKKMAIIEELNSKVNSARDKFLKPTQISSRRQIFLNTPLSSHSFNDETLESHATSAYSKSEKREPANVSNRKMVRRFSDLPSRADLENRLKFLEEQLNKTVCMQRRSSDSEVASKAALNNIPSSDSLEYRVQELEKRLKDNRTFSMDVECLSTNEKNDPNIEISQVELATDNVALTGKELVRYSSHGEVGDMEHQNPINININIQMTLNKEDIAIKKSTEVSKSDDLDKRLQFLEQQLKTTQVLNAIETTADNAKEKMTGKVEERNLTMTDDIENGDNNGHVGKCDVVNLNKIPKENKQNIQQLNNTSQSNDEGIQSQKSSEKNLSPNGQANHIAENTRKEFLNNLQELKQQVRNDLPQHDNSIKPDNSSQIIGINQQIEQTESTDDKRSDEQQVRSAEKQLLLIQEDKEIKNKTSEIPTKECNVLTKPKSEDNPSIRNTLKDESHQRNNEVSDAQEIGKLNENTNLQADKTANQKICEKEDKENIKIDHNFENKTPFEIEKFIGLKNCSQFVPVEVNKKTLVLLLDNEPKAVKVRRLTRANTQELEDLFQALEKQLNDRGHHKNCEEISKTVTDAGKENEIDTSKAMSDLTKEIDAFSQIESSKEEQNNKLIRQEKQKREEVEFDWGSDPIKYHLKKRTVYLPSTKELEARFRSLERQIKLLEDVEKIDVEQRLLEIERKIKLQYSLSHEKDLNKYLELCEGKDPDEISTLQNHQDRTECCVADKCNTHHTSPNLLKDSSQTRNIEYSYRSFDPNKSKTKQNLKKEPIHPLEMLLDPSPNDTDIPTTGELEHRMRIMEENRRAPSLSPARKSRSQSPPIKHTTASPTERELPTAEELEARLEALERDQCFNFKMQKNFQEFNQKLKYVVSPSLSFDEFKSGTKICDSAQSKVQPCSTPKQTKSLNTTSPKAIRFYEDQILSQKEIEFNKTFPENNKEFHQAATVREGLGVMGIRLMRETSPLRRKGTHTGIPLCTGENINDQLTSIQNTIKSIDSLCEEKPYRREKCQQYIDALFSDSTYFAHKKTSLEDLTSHNLSRSTSREIGPSIRISEHSPAISRSMGSADSIQSPSPLRTLSPLQYRSNRDLRRGSSPRRRREEDREEYESRVRRDNLLPNNINYSHSILSHTSHSSLTKFHKVDSQLISNDAENYHEESLQHPTTFSTIGNTIHHDNTNTSNNVNTTLQSTPNAVVTTPNQSKIPNLDSRILPLYQTTSSNMPVYTPAKLDIRHTTVTSTFYDRVLTEKQLEKQHHLSFPTPSQSPLISPQFEGHIKPIYQQQINKSPTKILHTDTINTLTLTGNYHRSHEPHFKTTDHS